MKHFSLEQWLDFVRELSPNDSKARMLGHLASGCVRCGRIVGQYRALLAMARSNSHSEVPEPVAESAKRIFSIWAWERRAASAPLSGRLSFDSLEQPAVAGVRGQRSASRQVLVRFGRYYLDLREQRDPGAPTAALIGQIADTEEPSHALASQPALLLSGNTVVAHALTNEFGEFHLEYRPRRSLVLMVMLEGGTATVDVSPRPEGPGTVRDPGPSFKSPEEQNSI